MCKYGEIITFDMESLTAIDLMNFSAAADDDEIPQELLLGKHQLTELSSESAKIKAMGIMHKVGTVLPLLTGETETSFKRQET